MAKRIYNIVQTVALLATQQGGYVAKAEIARTVHLASQQAFAAMLPAKNPRPMGPGLNREYDARLAPFLSRITPTVTNGTFTLPAELAYVDFYEAPGAESIDEVSGAAWNSRATCPVTGPTARHPIVGDLPGKQKRMLPVPTSVTVQGYNFPTEPKYVETYDGQGNPVYDDTASQDTGWGPEMDAELEVRTLRLMGLEIRDPALMQVAAQLTAETL